MTTSSDDLTTELPEFDATTPLPTTPAPIVGAGSDETTELPTSSPDLSSDPLAAFREAPTAQMPTDPFRSDAGTASPAGASGTQGPHAQAGSPAGSVGAGARTAFDPASTGESVPAADEAGAGLGAQAASGGAAGAAGASGAHAPGAQASGAQTWSAPAWPANIRDLPEAPSRGVRVGAFVWAVLVCMVGAFLIAEAYISTFNLPVLGISAVAAIGVILIITALFSGRSKKRKDTAAQASSPANAIRTD